MKQNLLLRFATLMLVSMLIPQAAWALSGEGTKDDPYIVTKGADLDVIRAEIEAGKWTSETSKQVYVSLANDIVLTSSFQPIGTKNHPFSGYFFGNFHTISGLNLNYTASNQGLFGCTYAAEISDFILKGSMTSTKSGLSAIGSVVGYADITKIVKVKSYVNITIKNVAQSHIGGIVGHMSSGQRSRVLVQNSSYHGVIDAGKSTDCIGGIAGFAHAEATGSISYCLTDGSIYSSASGPTIGGILGYNNNETDIFGVCDNCFSRAGLHHAGSNVHVGGIVGRLRAYGDRLQRNVCLGDSCANKGYNTDGPSIPESNYVCTFDECKSGAICYKLVPTYSYYYQKLGTHDYPQLNFELSGEDAMSMHVYKVQDKTCTGENVGNERYSNDKNPRIYHDVEKVEATASTCHSRGYEEHYKCKNCEKVFLDSEALQATSLWDLQKPYLPHTLRGNWTWYTRSVRLKIGCVNCSHVALNEDIYFTDPEVKATTIEASCSHRGGTNYVAEYTHEGVKYSDSHFVPTSPRLPHKFVNGECSVCHEGDYLTFTATGESSIALTNYNGNTPAIEYSIDGDENWTTWNYSAITLADGSEIKMRGVNAKGFSNPKNVAFVDGTPMSSFVMTGSIAASGRLMSLIDGHGTATVIPSESCFRDIFKACESLTTPPELTATTFTKECYRGMFYNCPGLTKAPALPVTKLAERCYYAMFYNCKSLTEAPALPATTLATGCYEGMFRSCTGIKTAPYLPAKKLASNCYYRLFDGCTSLNRVEVEFDDWNGATNYWLRDVAATGTFVSHSTLDCSTRGVNTIPEGWNWLTGKRVLHPNPISFTAQQESSSVQLYNTPNSYSLDYEKAIFQYSTDNVNWKEYDCSQAITLNKVGDKVYFRTVNDRNQGLYHSSSVNYKFLMTGKVAAAGSVMSLLYTKEGVDTLPRKAFRRLFEGCTALTKAPELPAHTLADSCYNSMFEGCTALTQAPELPAQSLAKDCYAYMFQGCTSLLNAPALPATTLASECYLGMFKDCESLKGVPDALPAESLAEICYNAMFKGCTSLTKAPALPATKLADYCYWSMFEGCTSLAKAPELPATTMAYYCYHSMFRGCTSLTEAPALRASTLADYCYNSMFRGCTSLGKAPELPATTLADFCYQSMFRGCTLLTEAPVLPATTLVKYCYNSMFYGCSSLNRVEVAFNQWVDGCTTSWLYKVAPQGKFICPENLEVNRGQDYIPEGWVVSHGEPEYQLGDVNGDGSVDVTDVTVLITKVLGGEPAEFIPEVADIDDNGVLDVTDVTVLISKILAM